MTAITIRDGAVVPVDPAGERNDILWHNLRKSIRRTCKHTRKVIVNRSRTGTGCCYAGFRCPDCLLVWNEQVEESEHQDALTKGDSMRAVYKYTIKIGEETTLSLPAGAEILTAAFQGPDLQVWAKVDTDAPTRERHFAVYGTGWEIPQRGMQYIATAYQNESILGPLVFHVFEVFV